MAGIIGYSLVNLETGTEIAWSSQLPWRVTYPEGTVDLDKVGLELPDGAAPKYRLVERYQTDEIPDTDLINLSGYESPTFDGNRINVVGIYIPIPPEELAQKTRISDLNDDAEGNELLNKLRTATVAEIKNYVNTHVTDLASARAMMIRIVLLLARSV